MTNKTPLTKKEREHIVATIGDMPDRALFWTERDLLRYEDALSKTEEELDTSYEIERELKNDLEEARAERLRYAEMVAIRDKRIDDLESEKALLIAAKNITINMPPPTETDMMRVLADKVQHLQLELKQQQRLVEHLRNELLDCDQRCIELESEKELINSEIARADKRTELAELSAKAQQCKREEVESHLSRLQKSANVVDTLKDALTEGRWLEAPSCSHKTYQLWDSGIGVGNAKLIADGMTLGELATVIRVIKEEN